MLELHYEFYPSQRSSLFSLPSTNFHLKFHTHSEFPHQDSHPTPLLLLHNAPGHGWLGGWFGGWLVSWLASWLAGWLVGTTLTFLGFLEFIFCHGVFPGEVALLDVLQQKSGLTQQRSRVADAASLKTSNHFLDGRDAV